MVPLCYASETLHIALVSMPQDDLHEFTEALSNYFYSSYQRDILAHSDNNSDATNNYLYKPLKYYIFGNYDVALISLVNNYKFAQKQLVPTADKDGHAFYPEPNSFQVITGSCPMINERFSAQQFFTAKQAQTEDFICISNLKLNNKLIIGNGNVLLQPLLKLIDAKIRDIFDMKDEIYPTCYFLQQSHSWFEITLVIFSNTIDPITKVLTQLRQITLRDVAQSSSIIGLRENILKSSMYASFMINEDELLSVNPHVFADTNSYFGVSFSYIHNFPDEQIAKSTVPLRTQIEWQVKPGHLSDLRKILSQFEIDRTPVFEEENFLLTGKTDYFIQERKDQLSNNIFILKKLKNNKEIFRYIRKIKTRILLEHVVDENREDPHGPSHPSFKQWLESRQLRKSTQQFNEINACLKKLKVSRNIRNKINKIYYNYNNGIQDPILFTYFLDFRIFIENLSKLISEEGKKFWQAFTDVKAWETLEKKTVNDIEKILVRMIDIFDEGYNTRMLNCHNYEDITDFDLDFNSSVQQLLTTYNTICANISNIFYQKGSHAPVVQLYLKNTVSSYETVNYDVYHLTSPEFVFFTLVKEVLNKFIYANEVKVAEYNSDPRNSGEVRPSIMDVIRGMQNEVKSSPLSDLLEHGLIDFKYYFLDAVKFIHTCNLDFELYQHWFWTYNFQNASMYDRIGTFNEEHFKMELTRLVFIMKLFGMSSERIECPLPEIYYLWERHLKSIDENLDNFFRRSKQIPLFKQMILTVFNYPQVLSPAYKLQQEEVNKINSLLEANLPANRAGVDSYGGINITVYVGYTQMNYERMIDSLKEGRPVQCNAEDIQDYFFINTFIYACLKLIYDRNKKVCLLRRSWENGNVLHSFIKGGPNDNLYYVDQFGGIFFANNKTSAEYFKIRNAVLQSLWHYSLLCKKELYFKG